MTTIFIAFCITICFIPISIRKLIPTVEKQVSDDLGIDIHVEKLILRLGPSLKVKAPVMHMMYEDGQKFGQFDNIKIHIPWSCIIRREINIKKISANNLILKINSNDKHLKDIIDKISSREFEKNPNIFLKKYSVLYRDSNTEKKYKFEGNNLSVNKLKNFKNFRFSGEGTFSINDNKYVNYDINVVPNIEIPKDSVSDIDIIDFADQIESLKIFSDLMLDLKLSKNMGGDIQASGLVNIDNLSVLDPEKKTQKSFIYLTFLGNKVGVLSNLYTTGDKKIYLEGVLSNSSKKELDLKVKTDDIKIEDLYRKVKFITDCSKLKVVESLKGDLSADFSLKGDINKIKSSGYFKLTNGSIDANGININKINSEIDFSNNVINITNATGYVKNAPIMLKGKIDKNLDLELIMSKVELAHICPQKYGVKSGIVSLASKFSGNLENIVHKDNLQIDNFSASANDNTISFTGLRIDTNKENIAYINNIAIKPKFCEVLKLPLLRLNIDNESIKIPETDIFMPNSNFKLKANISDYTSNDAAFNVNIRGQLNSKDVKALSSHQTNYPLKFNFEGNKALQVAEGQIQLEKATFLDEPALINLLAKFENNLLKIEDLSVLSFNGKFSDNLKTNVKGQKKVIISGNIENLKEPLFKNLRIFIPQQLNISVGDNLAQIKGDVFVNGSIHKPEIVGQFLVQNLINQLMQLSVNNMTVDFNKNAAVVSAPIVKLADSVMSVNAVLDNDLSKEAIFKSLNIKSKYINSDTILMYKDNATIKSFPFRVNEGTFYAEKASIGIYGTPILMSAINTDFKVNNKILDAYNIKSELYNGKLAANMKYNLKEDTFTGKFQGRGISASPIFEIVSPKKDSISGTLDFDSDLKGDIINKSSLNGNLKFIVHNGRMGTLGKLEHLLYAQNIIADNMLRTSLSVVTKAITLKDTGLFKYLRGDIKLRDGVADINFLQSQGPQMALFIKGQYNTMTDYAKLIVLGRLSDEIISGLGAFGEFSLKKLMIMLTGNENKYIVQTEDLSKLPQLPMRNTKEFRCIINGILEKPSSVLSFNWISYSQKSYRQKEIPSEGGRIPDFINSLPY